MPSGAPAELLARVEAGRAAVLGQVTFFHRGLGRAKSAWKADGSRVTEADIAISKNIFAELGARFPEDDFFSEELEDGGEPLRAQAEFAWVLDPIDGTNNYALGVPYCAISLALLRGGLPVYGIIYDASRRLVMHGGPGFGVWDGERRVALVEAPFGVHSFVGFHSPHEPRYAPHAAVLAEHAKLRALGASALHMAYVGVGLLDAVVDHNVKVWDIAAAVPLVVASGRVVDYVSESPFPLKHFDVTMGRTFCMAGSRSAVTRLRELLGV
ncbi:inositol monophosphatase [Cephaloticoccus primus]|uniref:Inositol monophosphatase n=1 Tax=Cephaloticoccus primus TaxID=1548207 RepID=A0A139SJK2_9BACT|nr:inositol monophosphatase [Cephaloticoccus primus]KXU34755.1 inositol monophosphatase [Cephaloticoccus primus]